MSTRPPGLASGEDLGQDYTLDYQDLLQLLRGASPHAARPGSCVEMSQDLEEDWPSRLVARGQVINWRHRVTTIVRQNVSKNTFQTAGTAKIPVGHLQTRSWDRVTLYPMGHH